MASQPARFSRARSPQEKQLRRGDILRAAERLWTTTPYAELSMNQVAREVKLAKGTLYLYFQTKEELFLALLGEHYQRWFARLGELLDEQQPRSPDEVARAITHSLRGFEPMRRLQLLLGSVLSRSDQSLDFRRQVLALMQQAALKLPYSPDVALRVLMHTEALCVGWQHLAECAPTPRLLVFHPEFGPLKVEAEREFCISLRALLHALPA